MEIKPLSIPFTVCKIRSLDQVDFSDPYCFVSKTDEEISLVCSTERTPSDVLAREDGFLSFRVQGVLDFSLVGILASIASLLAEQGISLFAISTFNTDYVLTKADRFDDAMDALAAHGYTVI